MLGKNYKVLILSKDITNTGGVVNFINMFAGHLAADIHKHHFFISKKKRFFQIQPLVFFFDAFKLYTLIRRNDFDIIHINPSFNLKSIVRDSFFLFLLHMWGYSRKTFIFFHGWDIDFSNTFAGNAFLRTCFGQLYDKAQHTVVLSHQFKQILLDIGLHSDRITVLSTMFDGSLINRPTGDRHAGFTLLFLSRFIQEKGVLELIAAFQKIRCKYPQARLILAGDGPAMKDVTEQVKERGLEGDVAIPGYVRDREKADLFSQADIFVLPTRHGEGCPVSLLEAMAAGLAVVTTPVGGVPEIIKDGVNGILLQDTQPETVAAAIDTLLADHEFQISAKTTNSRQAWENYEAKVVTQKIEAIYREIADDRL